MKEGPIEDFTNKERIAKLLRFASTETGSEEQTVSLEDYAGRMKQGQDKIYYITAESHAAARHSPHLEVFRKKGIEVLLLSDRVDEWLVAHLTEFDGKPLQSVARGDIDLGDVDDKEEKKAREEANKEFKDVIERVKKTLGDRISDARMSQRLTDSPSCLVLGEHDMSIQMQQILEAAGQYAPRAQPILELNSAHKLVTRLKDISDDDSFNDWVSLLFEQAQLAAGNQLDDPAGFVMRVNRLLES
jgi:molecular chaperone HtpG